MKDILGAFRGFPGGVAGLSERSGIGYRTLYRIAHGEQDTEPLRYLLAIAAVFQRDLTGPQKRQLALEVEFRPWHEGELRAAWTDARARELAGGEA